MEFAPVPVVGDTDVFCQALDIVRFDDRNGERERTVRRSDDATVAVGLLQVVLLCFEINITILQHFAILLNRSKVGSGEVNHIYIKNKSI